MKRAVLCLTFLAGLGLLAAMPWGCSDPSSSSPPNVPTHRVYVMHMDTGVLSPLLETGDASAAAESWEYELILESVSEKVLWYADRPGRDSGTETMEYFVQTVWPKVYAQISPNALFDGWIPPNTLNDGLYLILRNPQYDSVSKRLTFAVTLENSTMAVQHPVSPVVFEDIKITVLNNNEDGETDTYSFVQVSPSAYFEKTEADSVYILHLTGVYPVSFYLADAPDRFSFVYPTALFDLAWSNIFEDDPPNASMTSYTDDGQLKVQVVTLNDPEYDEAQGLLTYTATLLHGDIESSQVLSSPTLFIDAQDYPSCQKQMKGPGFTKRLTVINNCGEDTWLYMKIPGAGDMPEQWDFWKQASSGEEVWTGGSTGAGTGYVRSKIKVGVPYHFCIPDKGAAGGNFQVFMEPCKQKGDDCMIGTTSGSDRDGINTLFEPTFGCIPGNTCVKNPAKPSEDLTPADYFDISAVPGYTIPMYLAVTNGNKLKCDATFSDASMLDMGSCASENRDWPEGYGTTMVAVDPAPATKCENGQCTGNGYAPCHNDADCTDGNTQMREIVKAGFTLLTQDVDGRQGYQGCASPCNYLAGHELGNPPKMWTSPSGEIMGAMATSGWEPNTLPLNTACWYCCASTASADAPGQGGVQCDKGPNGVHPIGMSGYVRRLKEMGMNGYAWQYDDYVANHNCQQKSSDESARFLLTLCPGISTGASYPWPTGSKPFLKTQGWNWKDGTCSASNSGGTYKSLYACQTANLKYACKTVLSGSGDVSHKFCLPVESGGQSYEECRKSCY